MIKRNKWRLLISSIIILLPMIYGLLVWNKLPLQIPTHWGADGTVNGWSSRYQGVFMIPLFVLSVHWFCILYTCIDSKNRELNPKVFRLVLWICPVISIFTGGVIYGTAFGKTMDLYRLTILLVGLFFVVIGNYLPKCKQNHVIGVRIKWTLENEENWNATHRFCGKVWVLGGILMMLCALLPETISMVVLMILIAVCSLTSLGYSYYYFRKQQGR